MDEAGRALEKSARMLWMSPLCLLRCSENSGHGFFDQTSVVFQGLLTPEVNTSPIKMITDDLILRVQSSARMS